MKLGRFHPSDSVVQVGAGLLVGTFAVTVATMALQPNADEVRYAAQHAPGFTAPTGLVPQLIAEALALDADPAEALAPAEKVLPPGHAWRLELGRVDRAEGRAAATNTLMAAIRAPGQVPADTLIEASYAMGAPLALVTAAETGAIPKLKDPLALDLARRAEQSEPALIARIDRVAAGNWRRADPWLAFRLAKAAGDPNAAARAIRALPPAARDSAEEEFAQRMGGSDAVRALLIRRAAGDPSRVMDVAGRLETLGWRTEAGAVLMAAAKDTSPTSPVVTRLLAMWDIRPSGEVLAWLRERAARAANPEEHLAWTEIWASHVRPLDALPVLTSDSAADSTPMLLLRLRFAADAEAAGAAETALRKLLDGRALTTAQIAAASATLPADTDRALRLELAKRRVGAGIAAPRDRFDLGYASFVAKDSGSARSWLIAHLRHEPGDADAMQLMADVAAADGKRAEERQWLDRALHVDQRASTANAWRLSRAGRTREALTLVEQLRDARPDDRGLITTEARLLLAANRPGKALALFQR